MDARGSRTPFDVVLWCTSSVVLIIVAIPAFLPNFAKIPAILLVGYIHYRIIFTQTTGDFAVDLTLGSVLLVQDLFGTDYALFTSPDDLVDNRDQDLSRVTQRSFIKRVRWTLRLLTNPRGIGWAHEPSHLPPRPSPSITRWEFVFSRILTAIGCFSGIGALCVVNASNPGLTTPGKLLSEAPFHWRLLGVTSFASGGVFMISALNSILSAVVVGCGYSSPPRWPRLFGSPFQIWSIRKFWRRFWHQTIRRIVLTYTSIFLGYIFPASETKSILYKMAQLYCAFFLSGVIHMGGDAMVTGKVIFNKAFAFFMLQPVGITIELLVAYLWSHSKESQIPAVDGHSDGEGQNRYRKEPMTPLWIRCVGYAWLAFWMAWTAPYIVDPLCPVGVFRDPRLDLRRLL